MHLLQLCYSQIFVWSMAHTQVAVLAHLEICSFCFQKCLKIVINIFVVAFPRFRHSKWIIHPRKLDWFHCMISKHLHQNILFYVSIDFNCVPIRAWLTKSLVIHICFFALCNYLVSIIFFGLIEVLKKMACLIAFAIYSINSFYSFVPIVWNLLGSMM